MHHDSVMLCVVMVKASLNKVSCAKKVASRLRRSARAQTFASAAKNADCSISTPIPQYCRWVFDLNCWFCCFTWHSHISQQFLASRWTTGGSQKWGGSIFTHGGLNAADFAEILWLALEYWGLLAMSALLLTCLTRCWHALGRGGQGLAPRSRKA